MDEGGILCFCCLLRYTEPNRFLNDLLSINLFTAGHFDGEVIYQS